MVQIESSELRSTTDDTQFDDEDLEKMKKYVQELEVKNAELKQKLEAAEAKLKGCNKYIYPDPLIDAELMNCHDVFLCPDESGYEKLSEYLAHPQSKLTKVVKVPGRKIRQALKQLEKDLPICIPPAARSARDKPKEFRRMTPLAKYVILGIIEDIYRLHRHGISLNGKFTLENFYWTLLKKIKLAPVLKLVAIKRDRDEMINDYHQIHRVILEMLGNLPIPADLQSLLDLMNCADPIKNQHIIRYNVSLMTEIGKKSHFITLCDRLSQQILADEDKDEEKESQKVLQFITSRYGGAWSSDATDNSYVEAVYNLHCQDLGCDTLTEPLDLLIVWRNALTCMLDPSVQGGVLLFTDEDLVNILESAISGVFNELQRAMDEVGLLELPHLMRAMRM